MSEDKYVVGGDDELDQMLSDVGIEQALLPGSPLQAQPPESGTAASKQMATKTTSKSGTEPWMWADNAESEHKLRKLFGMIDRFEQDLPDDALTTGDASGDPGGADAAPRGGGDGGISSTELMHMLVNLGEDVPEDQADDMVDLIDSDGSEEIEFEEFYGVLTGRIPLDGSASAPEKSSLGGGRSIREIRKQFNLVDTDGGGFLDTDEVADLGEKMGQGLKRRHLLDAMAAMDPASTGEVTFDMFKNWLIDSKDGRSWYDFLILPESAVFAMRRKATSDKLLPPSGSPADEWRRLSVLMKLLDEATLLWGLPTDMYGVSEKAAVIEGKPGELSPAELEKEAMAMRCFLHPNMPIRTFWDIAQVILLLYLLITVPLRVAFDVTIEIGTAAFWFDVFVDLYFIVDIVFNFRTAYFDKRGIIVIDRTMIAKEYARSWLLIDVVTCLPINYIMIVSPPCTHPALRHVRASRHSLLYMVLTQAPVVSCL